MQNLNFVEILKLVLPNIVTAIAVIVPAVVTIKTRRIESKEKEQERLTSSWITAYFDFCSAFSEFIADGNKKEAAIKVSESAYKLAVLCDGDGYYKLISFAHLIIDLPEGINEPEQVSNFEACLKVIRSNLMQRDLLSR